MCTQAHIVRAVVQTAFQLAFFRLHGQTDLSIYEAASECHTPPARQIATCAFVRVRAGTSACARCAVQAPRSSSGAEPRCASPFVPIRAYRPALACARLPVPVCAACGCAQ